jgi:acetyltransferase-like isoleucine patch superfamily enzyme
VLPGSIIGKNAVLGSNSLCPKGWYLPESSVWLGSKGGEPDCLDAGVATDLPSKVERKIQMTGDLTTLRPFGKAFYMGKATYDVWPLHLIVAFCVCIKVFISIFHALPLLLGFYGASAVLYGATAPHPAYIENQYTFAQVYFALLFVYFFLNIVRVFLWLVIELVAKWTLIGRRQPGTYNYDTCSYAQRWELYQLISKIRKFSRYNFLQFFFGTPYMTIYFRLNGGNIGKDCCLYPSGADPFMPEPDLVNMGDRCVIDCASIVAHLNTRGNFDLATITLEEECTLRTRSRVQQGVYMEAGSQLLEKSLALTGEVIEAESVWQGGPASLWFLYSKAQSRIATPYGAIDSVESNDETTKLLSGKTLSYSQV